MTGMRLLIGLCVLVFCACGPGAGLPPGSGSGGSGGSGGGPVPNMPPLPCGSQFDSLYDSSLVPFGVVSTYGVCSPLNKSLLTDRAEIRVQYAGCLETNTATAPGQGTYQVHRSNGHVTSVTFDPPNGEGYNETFYWSGDHLTSWGRDYTGSTESVLETFYWSQDNLTSWHREYSGSTENMTETFYYSNDKLTSWHRDYSGSSENVTETLYFSSDDVTSWHREFSGSSPSVTEAFSYSSGKLQSWRREYSGPMPNDTATVYWNGSTVSQINSAGTDLQGLQIAFCP
jgi:hypothetical protein